MIADLILASVVTIVLGTLCLVGWFSASFAGRDALAMAGVALSILAGPFILWLRGTKPLIPVAAIYCVVMLIVLLFINFTLAWSKGSVDL